MSSKLLEQLSSCNLKMAAFSIVKAFSEGIYKREFAAAIDLFTKLPCPETAVNLIYVCPDFLKPMSSADDSFIKITPIEHRGPYFQGFEEWMASFDRNLQVVQKIHSYLFKEASKGKVRVGFHGMRDQAILFQRLERIGIKKGFFKEGRQFLRDSITKNISPFRAVCDLICLHGIHNGKENYWNTLGKEVDAQFYLQAEILYNLSLNVEPFLQILEQT
jgi:hypothetical protein